jgi:hypothetical protein
MVPMLMPPLLVVLPPSPSRLTEWHLTSNPDAAAGPGGAIGAG